MFYLVLDLACHRVIHFTHDSSSRLIQNEHIYFKEWFEELPIGMTLSNCWDWKLVGDKLVLDTGKITPIKKSLLDHNKERIQKYLIDRVNGLRNNLVPDCLEGDYLRALKLGEARNNGGPMLNYLAENLGITVQELVDEVQFKYNEYKSIMARSEIFRIIYKTKIEQASDNQELYKLRDEIAIFDIDTLETVGFRRPQTDLTLTAESIKTTQLVKQDS